MAKKKPKKPVVSLEQRFRDEPGLLDKYLKNPGLRSKLPDSRLTPEQRQQREIARDPYHKTIESMASQKFGDAVGQVGQAQKQSDVQQGNITDWFGQYQAELAKSRDRQKALQDSAVGSVDARTQSFASMNNQANAQQQAGMQADAANRGATVGPEVGKVAGDANTVRESLGKQSANTLATQGVSNNAAAEAALSAASGEGALAHQRESGVRSKLDQSLRDLLKERDAFKVSARGDLVNADQKAILEAKAFGLDVDQAAIARRDKEQRRIESRRANRSRETIAQQNADTAKFNAHKPPKPGKPAAEKKPTSGPGSLTVSQENAIHGDISRAQALIKKAMNAKDPETGKPYTPTQIRQALQAGEGTPGNKAFPKDIVNIAMDLIVLKGISRANVRAAHRLGVHVGGRYKVLAPKTKKKPDLPGLPDLAPLIDQLKP